LQLGLIGCMICHKMSSNPETKASRVTYRPPVTWLNGQGPTEALPQYLKEIGRIPLLDATKEVDLAKKIELGKTYEEMLSKGEVAPEQVPNLEQGVAEGMKAKKNMVAANLRLVVAVAKRYEGRGLDLEDLISEGNLGLQKAVEKYDWKRGFRLSTYATWWIRQTITRAIADQARTIRIPVHMVEILGNLGRTSRRLVQERGREPTDEELAQEVGLPIDKFKDIQRVTRIPFSLNSPLGGGEDEYDTLEDLVEDESSPPPFEHAARALLEEDIYRVIDDFPARERRVLELRFGLNDGISRTLEEVGREFGVTRERIRQNEADALRRLRTPGVSSSLRDYWD
jgi:RNA polymerase primary sigma factor